jgi:hypothetical protein
MHVLLPDAELGEQALGFLERAGIQPGFDLGMQRMVERSRLAGRVARAADSPEFWGRGPKT